MRGDGDRVGDLSVVTLHHHGSSGDVTIVGQGQGWLALRLRRLNPIGRNSRLVRLESWFPILVAVAIQAWHSAGLRSTRSHLSPA